MRSFIGGGIITLMDKFKNAINNLKAKICEKLNKNAETTANTINEENLVIVSDYAVAQGAQCNELTGDEVHDRYHWIKREELQPKFHETKGELIPNFYEKPTGMIMDFQDTFYHRLKVEGGYLTHNHEYVYFPQKRVEQELSDYLTQAALGKVVLPESEFGPLAYKVRQYGTEIRNGIDTASYYYQGQAYCVRVDKQNNQAQWFYYRPVIAKWAGDNIECEDVLLADCSFNRDKFLADLKNSVTLNHSIPLLYARTPRPNKKSDLGNDGLEK